MPLAVARTVALEVRRCPRDVVVFAVFAVDLELVVLTEAASSLLLLLLLLWLAFSAASAASAS